MAQGPTRKERISAERLRQLREYTGDDEILSSYELEAYFKAIDAKRPQFSARCGIPGIDAACGGFEQGELVVVTGPTKSGKTLLMQTMTRHFATRYLDAPCLWFSYEVPPRQFLKSFGETPPLFYLPKQLEAQSIDWWEERCLEAWEKQSTKIIFIDHLHFLVDQFKLKSPSLELGAIVRRIKRFAVDFDFVIFLASHITKVPAGERPRYHHIRDSSFIAQESDCVLLIWRVREKNGSIQNRGTVSVEFHRRTGVMEREVDIEKQGTRIVELAGELR